MGDFTGFSFGGYHSFDDLGIIRVSGGDRYEERLHPEIKDKTAEVPGRDGSYYFGSDCGTRTIDISIAFDSLTEIQLRKLKQVFGTKDIKKLIFDEYPYKYYMAKIESPIELSYVCFDEPKKTIGAARDGVRVVDRTTSTEEIDGEEVTITTITREQVTPYVYDYTQTQRIYKGEGKISFICYFPFAKSVYKVLPAGEEGSDWAISSGILNSAQYANIDNYSDNRIRTYNPGDIETGFRLYLPSAALSGDTILIYKADRTNVTATLELNPITLKGTDEGVLIDTNNQLIIGSSPVVLNPFTGEYTYTTSGNLYNEAIAAGYFFHLQPNVLYSYSTIEISGGANGIMIFYDYLYF